MILLAQQPGSDQLPEMFFGQTHFVALIVLTMLLNRLTHHLDIIVVPAPPSLHVDEAGSLSVIRSERSSDNDCLPVILVVICLGINAVLDLRCSFYEVVGLSDDFTCVRRAIICCGKGFHLVARVGDDSG